MNRVITTLLFGVLLSTVIATNAMAEAKPSPENSTVNQPTTAELDRIYVEKFGS